MQGLNVSDPQVTVILQGVGRGEGDAGGQPRSGGDGVDLKTDANRPTYIIIFPLIDPWAHRFASAVDANLEKKSTFFVIY